MRERGDGLGMYDVFGGVLYFKFILSSAWKKCCEVSWNKAVTGRLKASLHTTLQIEAPHCSLLSSRPSITFLSNPPS